MAGRQRPPAELEALAQERLRLARRGPRSTRARPITCRVGRHHRVGVGERPPAQREDLAALPRAPVSRRPSRGGGTRGRSASASTSGCSGPRSVAAHREAPRGRAPPRRRGRPRLLERGADELIPAATSGSPGPFTRADDLERLAVERLGPLPVARAGRAPTPRLLRVAAHLRRRGHPEPALEGERLAVERLRLVRLAQVLQRAGEARAGGERRVGPVPLAEAVEAWRSPPDRARSAAARSPSVQEDARQGRAPGPPPVLPRRALRPTLERGAERRSAGSSRPRPW